MKGQIKTGINFKQTPKKKLLLIQPETFADYLSSLPRSERGWIAFEFQELKKLTPSALFARIHPQGPKEEAA